MSNDPKSPRLPTLKRLFAFSQNQCAFTGCKRPLADDTTVFGEICHIEAQAVNGPRYNPNQSAEERHHFDNLILLCPEHHKTIDNDPSTYTVTELKKMKAAHERETGIPETLSDQVATQLFETNVNGDMYNANSMNFHNYYASPAPADPPSAKATRHNLPQRSLEDFFMGRAQALENLHKALLKTGQVAVTQARVIHGLGGIGKTRLALEYAWSHFTDYETICFVVAESAAILDANLANLDTVLDLATESPKQAVRKQTVLNHLQHQRNWLLILDNVDAEDAVEAIDKLQAKLTGGHILITSRNTRWSKSIQAQDLAVLDEATVTAYLLKTTEARRQKQSDDPERAHDLAKVLGGLPLAMEQAAAQIGHLGLSFTHYLDEWDKNRKKVLAWYEKRTMDYPVPLAITWSQSFDFLTPMAHTILRHCAFLASEPIPIELFQGDPKGLAEDASIMAKDLARKPLETDARTALAELDSWSLVKRTGDSVTVHRLVKAVLRTQLTEAQQRAWLIRSLRLMKTYAPEDTFGNPKTWPTWKRLRSHVTELVTEADLAGLIDPTADLMTELGAYLKDMGLYDVSMALRRRALALCETGDDPKAVATAQSNLATVLQDLGELEEARDLLRSALASDQKSYEPGHPVIAIRQSNLAVVLRDLGELEEARDLLRRALASDQKSYEPGHPEIAIRQSNLAVVLQDLGELEEARDLLRSALASAQKSYEPGHPYIAISQSNLAVVLKDLGELEEARDLLRSALVSAQKSYEPGHPSIAIRQSNLAAVLKDLGELEEGKTLVALAHATFLRIFGPDHPRTKGSRRVLDSFGGP